MTMNIDIALHLGALSDPISKQLHAVGLKMDIEKCRHRQKDAEAITRLCVRGLISDSVAHKARQKLVNEISKEVGPI